MDCYGVASWVWNVLFSLVMSLFGASMAPADKLRAKSWVECVAQAAYAASTALLFHGIRVTCCTCRFMFNLTPAQVVHVAVWTITWSLTAFAWLAVVSAALVVVWMHVTATLVVFAFEPLMPGGKAVLHRLCYILKLAPTAPAYALELMLVGSAVAMAAATWCLAWFCVGLVLSLASSFCDLFSVKAKAIDDDCVTSAGTIGDNCDAFVVVSVGASTSNKKGCCATVCSEAACDIADCVSDACAVGLSASPSLVSVAADSCVSGCSSRLPSSDGSDGSCDIDSRRSSRLSASSDCPSVANQSSPAVCSNAASPCVEPVGSWGARDPYCQWPEPLPPPTFVLEVCRRDGELCCYDGRFVRWVPRWAGAKWFDRVVYCVERFEGPDGSRLEAFDVVGYHRPGKGEWGPDASDEWQIAAALVAAYDQW